jgi:hypothetical protein
MRILVAGGVPSVDVRGIRYTADVLDGKFGKSWVFPESRYHGPMTCDPRPVVRMSIQSAEYLIL